MRTIEGLSVTQKAEQFDILMNLIRKKVTISDTGKNIQLLTLAHQTCSRNTLADFFGICSSRVTPNLRDNRYPWRGCT